MKRLLLTAAALVLGASVVSAQDTPTVPVNFETQPSPGDDAAGVAIWLHPRDVAQSLLLTTDQSAGLVTYDLDGQQQQLVPIEGEVSPIDVRYQFPLNGEPSTLIAVGVNDEPLIHFLTIDTATREVSMVGTLETEFPNAGMCLYFSPTTDTYYVFNTSGEGEVEQYELTDDGSGEIDATLRRSFNVGSETESCTADDERGNLFIAEGEVALWRYRGEPESGTQRNVIDYVGGNVETEIEGITLLETADGAGYLIATDEGSDRYLVYGRDTLEFIGAFGLSAGDADQVSEPGGVEAISLALNDTYPDGLFITSDSVNSSPNEDVNFKLVSWGEIASALDLITDPTYDARAVEIPTGFTQGGAFVVTAVVETEPVPAAVDAADDPAVWIHPTDPALSTIIGTDKTAQGGLVVYNLDGTIRQRVAIGEVNNVDLRYNFPLDGEPTTIVAATNRTFNSLVLYRVDETTGELIDVAAREIVSGVNEVYGFCMYVSPATGLVYAFINSATTGEVEQWELSDNGSGQVDAELVREFSVGSQTEGCVADDELGVLYIGEEASTLWKYGAEPDAGDERVAVDSVEGHLVADIEGLALYYAADGAGYLIASSQGSSEFIVYERGGDNAYVGKFTVAEGSAVDGISGTDGIDVSNAPLGNAFPNGVFVAQDDTNINPDGNQNFKLVDWGVIAEGLDLLVDTSFEPRAIGAS